MSNYGDEVVKYKAKRIGQTDAKVVAPKGRKKKVDKPWVVWLKSEPNRRFEWEPWKHEFAKEHDARAFLRKSLGLWKESWLEHNGVRIE